MDITVQLTPSACDKLKALSSALGFGTIRFTVRDPAAAKVKHFGGSLGGSERDQRKYWLDHPRTDGKPSTLAVADCYVSAWPTRDASPVTADATLSDEK